MGCHMWRHSWQRVKRICGALPSLPRFSEPCSGEDFHLQLRKTMGYHDFPQEDACLKQILFCGCMRCHMRRHSWQRVKRISGALPRFSEPCSGEDSHLQLRKTMGYHDFPQEDACLKQILFCGCMHCHMQRHSWQRVKRIINVQCIALFL